MAPEAPAPGGLGDQPQAAALLARALAGGRLAHAWAFVGPPGSGRTGAALEFAQGILCSGDREADSGRGWADPGAPRLRLCGGSCRHCRLVAARQHPDLHLIVATPPASNPRGARAIRIDAIREVERLAALRPVMAARKVFILDDAERMTEDAPQAFLKTLEEPPAGTVLILVLPRARALPATVLSRCQVVRFAPRPSAGADEARAQARALLDEARAQGFEALLRRLDRVDRERAEALVDAYWLLCRDLLLAQAGAPARLLASPERAEELAREAAAWRADDLLGLIALCRQARDALLRNVSPRLTLEVLVGHLAARAA